MPTRIIVKKKVSHATHHGGAWKVAYADFVTALMALFIVLWLVGSSKAVQDAVGGYFRDPLGTAHMTGSLQAKPLPLAKDDLVQLKENLLRAMQRLPDFEKLSRQIEITFTAEGLRIELIESANGTFFALGSPVPNENCRELLTALAGEIAKFPNLVAVEGHTDAKPYDGQKYSNWELSTDRANAARKIMNDASVPESQFSQVRGYADRDLRYKDDPDNPANRRISVIVQYRSKDDARTTPPASLSQPPSPEQPSPPAPSQPSAPSASQPSPPPPSQPSAPSASQPSPPAPSQPPLLPPAQTPPPSHGN
jgi:chemotaxis protein MotB